ncbi:hypothetical protein QBC34DRAFT_401081 [Podospora aff. communis PSN243]|uniref:Uncharacterized protein n=1 Tax=Podospora aff. communis PSN243 TaxID=3040156 RepID=A0AAV9GT53_9PEZI|nr:hypothetical protein QBC34DRAFT_401081 [Podospora aff. communis PSN243]
MCYHWRVIFKGCGHHAWGGMAKACEVEKKFNNGETDEGCSEMWSRTVCTILVKPECRDCVKKSAKIEKKLDAAKDIISKLRCNLAKRVAKDLSVDAPETGMSEELRALDESLDSEDLDEDGSDDEVLSEIDIDEFDYMKSEFTPSFSSTKCSSSEDEVRSMTKETGAAGTRKVGPVKPEPSLRPLYLPILAQMSGVFTKVDPREKWLG